MASAVIAGIINRPSLPMDRGNMSEENDSTTLVTPQIRHPVNAASAAMAVAVGGGPGVPVPLQPQNGNVFGNNMAPIEASGPDVGTVTGSSTGPGGPSGAAIQICAGCGVRIVDRYFLQSCDRLWHTACLKCSCCRVNLGEIGTSCYTRSGMILCKTDYLKMFAPPGTCANCGQQIPADEMVMRCQGNVYHIKCFTCVHCNNPLQKGDKYTLFNGSLICEHEFPKLFGLASTPSSGRGRQKKMASSRDKNNSYLQVC